MDNKDYYDIFYRLLGDGWYLGDDERNFVCVPFSRCDEGRSAAEEVCFSVLAVLKEGERTDV